MNSILNLSAKAQEFYEKGRSRTLVSGYERNVLTRTDSENCLFVDANYILQPGDVIFRCQTINQQTVISLKTAAPEAESLEKTCLKGRFTSEEWRTMLNNMNGVQRTLEIDPRDEISGEIEDMELVKKIKEMGKCEGEILFREIEKFWNNRIDFDDFVSQF